MSEFRVQTLRRVAFGGEAAQRRVSETIELIWEIEGPPESPDDRGTSLPQWADTIDRE